MAQVPAGVHRLEIAELRSPKDIPNDPMECGRPGVYTIWYGSQFLYVGMAYIDREKTGNPQAQGVYGRLSTHARARPTSDLWLAFCERFIIPRLSSEDLVSFARAEQRLQDWLSKFTGQICYRAIITTGQEARSAEASVRRFGLPSAGLPLFNWMV